MLGFGRKRIDKAKWAEAVVSRPVDYPDRIPEDRIRSATGQLIGEYKRTILESAQVIRSAQDEEARSYEIDACRHRRSRLHELMPFADREQRKAIRECDEILKELGVA